MRELWVARQLLRLRARTARTAALVLVACTAMACVGNAPTEPTLPTVDFTPKVVLDVGNDRVVVKAGARPDASITLDPVSVGSGTVVEVVNSSGIDQRLRGNAGEQFDTGTLRPGERTTVVLTNKQPDDLTIAVTRTDGKPGTTIVVRGAPSS